MTCIAAVKHENTIYMGADGIFTSAGSKGYTAHGKIVRKNNMLIGVSGYATWATMFRLDPDFPVYDINTDFEQWLNFPFYTYLHEIAKGRGYLTHATDGEENVDLNLVIGYNGELHLICSDLSSELVVNRDYCAVGSGRDEAFGSLYSTQMLLKDQPQRRVEMALNAAAEMRPTIQGPFTFEVLKLVPGVSKSETRRLKHLTGKERSAEMYRQSLPPEG